MMLSKNQIKFICSLHQKKNREIEGLFLVEGDKIVHEVLSQDKYKIQAVIALKDWFTENSQILNSKIYKTFECNENDLSKISNFKTHGKVILVVHIDNIKKNVIIKNKNLVLDNLQDPGNLGTIIRIADWFGIENIFCSETSVELYNPKVLQSTMGSFLRVNIHYVNLENLFLEHPNIPRYAAVLKGKNAKEVPFEEDAFIIIGNESKGISNEILNLQHIPISIPKYGHAESLNAAVATGILCSMIKN
jgi:TrmH family RNA methyltransferase